MTRQHLTTVYEAEPGGVYRRTGRMLLRYLLPMPCLACSDLATDGIQELGLCARCRGAIIDLYPPLCPLCCLPVNARRPPNGFTCLTCRANPPGYDLLTAPWSYEPPVDLVVRALKFSRLPQLARPLGYRLARHVRGRSGSFDVVTFVPLHWRRRLARGYDQAEELARHIARDLGLALRTTLSRSRPTKAQSQLPLSRRAENVTKAFSARRRAGVGGCRVLLIDDVATSGATLSAAALCLKAAGASAVTAAVAARTPPPERKRTAQSSAPQLPVRPQYRWFW